MTVIAGLASSMVMPSWKLSLTRSGNVLSKQLKANVARKKMKISRPIFGCDSVWPHCAKRGRLATGVASGFQLSARMKYVRTKFSAHNPAAAQPGAAGPPNFKAIPLMAGPKINPRPNAMPIRPIRFERFSGGVMSAM